MATIQLISKYRKNSNLLMSPEDIMEQYFYGIEISSKDGKKLSDVAIEQYIKSAQSEIEKYLAIRIKKRLETENGDFVRDEFSLGYPVVNTSFHVNTPYRLNGMLNSIEQIVYPESWLTANTSEGKGWDRAISVVPNGTTADGNADVILVGISSQYTFQSQALVPTYWTMQYTTGFDWDSLPHDIIDVIGKKAAIGVFNILGDIVLGAGIASMSLGLDGLSQSIATTSSAENAAYSARIKQYQTEIKDTLKRLKTYYKGYAFAAC